MKYKFWSYSFAVLATVAMNYASGERLLDGATKVIGDQSNIPTVETIYDVLQSDAHQLLGRTASEVGSTNWQAIPHLVLSATDNHCEVNEQDSCKLHLEIHKTDVAYVMSTGVKEIHLKQTSSGITRRDAQGTEKTLPPQAAASIPDLFPLPRLLKTLEDSSLSLTVTANEGGIITVTSEPISLRKLPNDPLASLNTRRFKIDAATGELRAIEFTIASIGNSRLNKPAKVSYFNYKKAPSGVMYPEEIKFEIDGHLVNDYHVTQVDTTSTTFTEQ